MTCDATYPSPEYLERFPQSFLHLHACRFLSGHPASHGCECSFVWTDTSATYPAPGKRSGRLRWRVRVVGETLRLIGLVPMDVREIITDPTPVRRRVVLEDEIAARETLSLTRNLRRHQLPEGFMRSVWYRDDR